MITQLSSNWFSRHGYGYPQDVLLGGFEKELWIRNKQLGEIDLCMGFGSKRRGCKSNLHFQLMQVIIKIFFYDAS